MNSLRYLTVVLLVLQLFPNLQARDFVGENTPPRQGGGGNNGNNNNPNYRAQCVESRSETDLSINNVRAHLRAGGDVWWDGTRARYIVPNVDPASGLPEISSLFSGAIWLGAYDEGGNLIVAAQTYRASGNDYWTGPLNPSTGTIEKADCEKWDRHFRVLGADIDLLRADFFQPNDDGQPDYTIQSTPSRGLLGWPGRGNPYFADIYGYELPDQDLAPFVEPVQNADGIYDPKQGDHPVVEVVGCSNDYINPVYADEMIWWVYNDKGNLHGQTSGQPMFMEVQALAFAYRTTDAINNMTFYRYKLLNRNTLTVRETYFSLWSDPDLGCYNDDYIGCDTTTGMGYVYNADANDDATCGTSLGYGAKVPALGVDYFRGPLDSAGRQIGLSSFMYHVGSSAAGNRGDPSSAIQYYRLQTGRWLDNSPVTRGGTGFNAGSTDSTDFVFPDFPSDQSANAWSMCHGGNTGAGDFRFMHTSGPFVLKPGATNELISGVVWVPELPDYPCPSLRELVDADVLAQNLFDDCFKITDGPDAPYMDIVELKNELILNLSYTPNQNNYQLGYEEFPAKLRGFPDSSYNFEGYIVYQVKNANTSVTDLQDPAKARLIYQCDVRNGVSKIVNWTPFPDKDVQAFVPEIMIDGVDKGIQHTFRVKKDEFAAKVPTLVNHKPYYFCVVAYGFNEYLAYNPTTNTGQALPYLQGRRNFRIYTGVPRINAPEYYGATINAEYGDRPEITRVDGRGNGGGLFLDFVDKEAVETNMFSSLLAPITYAKGKGPVDIKVVDPLRVAPGTFQLYIGDEFYRWNKDTTTGVYTPVPPAGRTAISDSLFWVLKDKSDPLHIWSSYQDLTVKYEQFIPDLGISLSIEKISPPGSNGISGWIGSSMEYKDSATAVKWYNPVKDQSSDIFNMLKTGNAQPDNSFDPSEDYSSAEGGWYPVLLCDCKFRANEFYFTPNQVESNTGVSTSFCTLYRNSVTNRNRILGGQRNVNVVITPDQSKWSRCIVTETGTIYHTAPAISDPTTGDPIGGLGLILPSGYKQLEWKKNAPSIDKNGNVESNTGGMSWFPGYAYDVETGERLNIFFGENSFYDGGFFTLGSFPGAGTGNDMIYNPTDMKTAGNPFANADKYLGSVLGGQHTIYVANSKYDECQYLVDIYNLPPNPIQTPVYRILKDNNLLWASMGYMNKGTAMQGAKSNIPPSEVTFKLRVGTPYEIFRATNNNEGYPLYEFSMQSLSPTKQNLENAKTALDLLNVVPNPYYAYSDYEVKETDNVIKITNVPPKCNVRIYSFDGRFIKDLSTSQDYNTTVRSGIANIGAFGSSNVEQQITTSIQWDLKNTAGVPVASGVYLIHVVVPGVGERVLKSFIIERAFDSQKL